MLGILPYKCYMSWNCCSFYSGHILKWSELRCSLVWGFYWNKGSHNAKYLRQSDTIPSWCYINCNRITRPRQPLIHKLIRWSGSSGCEYITINQVYIICQKNIHTLACPDSQKVPMQEHFADWGEQKTSKHISLCEMQLYYDNKDKSIRDEHVPCGISQVACQRWGHRSRQLTKGQPTLGFG